MQFQRKKRRKVTTDFFKEPLFYLCIAKEKLLPVMGIGLVLFFLILSNSESVGMASVGVVIAVDLMCIFVLVSYVKKGNKS